MTSTQTRPSTTAANAQSRNGAHAHNRNGAHAQKSAGTAEVAPEHASTEPQGTATAGTGQGQAHQVQQLDPGTLLVDLNVRHAATADADLVTSVTEHGVLVPIVAVRTAQGQVRVRMGHRRTLAAIAAGQATVPVVVVADEACDDAGSVHRLVTQWAENEHRAGLTTAERADVIGQLSAFGVSPTQIARRTRATKSEVSAALAVTASELARAATARYDFLDLAQAATVADFDTDPDAVKALVVGAREGRFDHVAQRLRDERTAAKGRAAADRLRECGVRVIDTPTTGDPARPLHRLTDTEGAGLTETGHAQCPGHAAHVAERYGWVDGQGAPVTDNESDDEDLDDEDDEDDEGDEADGGVGERHWRPCPVPVFVCTDPAAHGHRDSWVTSSTGSDRLPVDQMTDAQRETARAQRRDVIDSNKAWVSAETVRRDWLRALAARKTAPKGTAVFLAAALARDADLLADVGGNHLAADLLGAATGTYGRSVELAALVEKASDARALLLTLVMVLAAYEGRTDRNDWRTLCASTGRYLTHLQDLGYALADVERRACGQDPLPATD